MKEFSERWDGKLAQKCNSYKSNDQRRKNLSKVLVGGVPLSQIIEDNKPHNQIKFLERLEESTLKEVEAPEALKGKQREEHILKVESIPTSEDETNRAVLAGWSNLISSNKTHTSDVKDLQEAVEKAVNQHVGSFMKKRRML